MGQITIRIDDELEKQIDERRGDNLKSDFYRDILKGYLTTTDDNLITPAIIQNSDYIKSLEQQIADLRADKDQLMTLLDQEQALHMQTQSGVLMKLLLPAPEGKKKWWKFW